MSIDLVQLTRRSFWSFLLVLIFFFVVVGSYVGYEQHEMVHHQAETEAEQNVNMLGNLIHEPLTKGDYVTVEDFLTHWAVQRGDVVSVQLVSANGFTLAAFQRDEESPIPLEVSTEVKYGRGSEARLSLVMDGEPVHAAFRQFVVQAIVMTTLGMFLLGFMLWRTLRDTAITPLKAEVAHREAAEQRFRALVENAPDPIILHDLAGKILTVNRQACESLGYNYDELIRLSVFEIEQNTNTETSPRLWKGLPRGKSETIEGEHRRKDGSLFPVEVRVTKFLIDNEPVIQVFARDISERKQSEEALRAAKDEAERASQAKSEFLSRMSHELRTPMNAILGFSQIMITDEQSLTSQEHKEFAKEILRAGHHLLGLINDVLDISRIESNSISLSLESVSLVDVVQASLTMVKSQAQESDVRLRVDLSSCDNCLVEADFVRLKQVLLNLLSNAVKYNKRHGEVVLSCEPPGPETIRLSVHDTGVGMSQKQLQNLYHPFDRLGAEATGIEGTGIGLVIAKRLMELMGGSVNVESVEGEGSCFKLDLKRAESVARKYVPRAESKPLQPVKRHEKTVLYVEDNPANLRLVERLVQRKIECEFVAADTPEVALQRLEECMPDLVLLDINLPGMSGFDLLRRIRTNDATRHLPVVAISANAMPSDIEKAKLAGFNSYIVKPIDVNEFYATVDQYLSE